MTNTTGVSLFYRIFEALCAHRALLEPWLKVVGLTFDKSMGRSTATLSCRHRRMLTIMVAQRCGGGYVGKLCPPRPCVSASTVTLEVSQCVAVACRNTIGMSNSCARARGGIRCCRPTRLIVSSVRGLRSNK